MAYSFEVLVDAPSWAIFQEALSRYMENAGFIHMSVGGLGGSVVRQFRRGDDLVSLNVTDEAHGRHRIVLHSETLPVDQMVLEALHGGAASFIEPFLEAMTVSQAEEFREALAQGLRDILLRIHRGEH